MSSCMDNTTLRLRMKQNYDKNIIKKTINNRNAK